MIDSYVTDYIMFDYLWSFWNYNDGEFGEFKVWDYTNIMGEEASKRSFFDIMITLVDTKISIIRKVPNFTNIMEEIGGFAETCFGILTIVFATYA
jgi:hypothetical protein